MGKVSVTTAWNETVEFVKREARLILPIAFLLVALPGALLQIVMPTQTPGEPPEAGLWLLLIPIVVVAGMIGGIAISYLALRPGTSVGEALQVGLRRFVMLLGASLLIGLAFAALLIPLVFLAGGGAAAGGGDPAAVFGSMLLVLFVLGIVAVAIWVRLMVMTPVAAVEHGGPVAIIRRSWTLTRGYFWKLLGLVLLLLIAGLVIMLVVSMILGILVITLAGPPDPQSLTMILIIIVSALVQSILGALFTILVARLYHQLSGGTPGEVFA